MSNHSDLSKNLTVILPTLNEAGNILSLTERIWTVLPNSIIVVVDDGSTDDTQTQVLGLKAQGKAITLIARTAKPCLTDSLNEGIAAATTEYVAWMDADLSHPPELLPQLYEASLTSGCSIATRFANGGSYKKNTKDTPDSFLATILSLFMNIIVHKWLSLSISDYTSGFIVVRRSLLTGHKLYGDYGEYFIELMYYLSRTGVRIGEVAYHSPPRQWGESKTGSSLPLLFRRGLKYLWLSIRLKLPTTLFGRLSMARPDSKRN